MGDVQRMHKAHKCPSCRHFLRPAHRDDRWMPEAPRNLYVYEEYKIDTGLTGFGGREK